MRIKFLNDAPLRRIKYGTVLPMLFIVIGWIALPEYFHKFLGFIILGTVIISGLWNWNDWNYIKHAVEEITLNSDGTIELKEFKINKKPVKIELRELILVSLTETEVVITLTGRKLILRKNCVVEGDWEQLLSYVKQLHT